MADIKSIQLNINTLVNDNARPIIKSANVFITEGTGVVEVDMSVNNEIVNQPTQISRSTSHDRANIRAVQYDNVDELLDVIGRQRVVAWLMGNKL